jgi:hypothetical protein
MLPLTTDEKTLYVLETTLENCERLEMIWRSVTLLTSGNSLSEMLDNASIEEIDAEGGVYKAYELLYADDLIYTEALKAINTFLKEKP